MGRAGLGKKGCPGAGVETREVARAEEWGRGKAWEGAGERAGVGARPASPRSLGAAHGSPGTDDPALASPQSTGLRTGWLFVLGLRATPPRIPVVHTPKPLPSSQRKRPPGGGHPLLPTPSSSFFLISGQPQGTFFLPCLSQSHRSAFALTSCTPLEPSPFVCPVPVSTAFSSPSCFPQTNK